MPTSFLPKLRNNRPDAAGARVLDAERLGDHLDPLYRAALSMSGSRTDADDLVQEVCVRVLAKPRLVRGDERAYLLGVLRNTFRCLHRTQRRRGTTPVEPAGLEHLPASRRHDPELGAHVREIQRAISELPSQFRDAVVAVDVLGLRYTDAAAALGVPEGTIMSRLYRGRATVASRVAAPAH